MAAAIDTLMNHNSQSKPKHKQARDIRQTKHNCTVLVSMSHAYIYIAKYINIVEFYYNKKKIYCNILKCYLLR